MRYKDSIEKELRTLENEVNSIEEEVGKLSSILSDIESQSSAISGIVNDLLTMYKPMSPEKKTALINNISDRLQANVRTIVEDAFANVFHDF